MLNIIFITHNFHRFIQSGAYLDFFVKKISEFFVKNILIYLSQFFSEKYIIEYLTKKIISNTIFLINKYLNFNDLSYFNFFFQILVITFYLLSLLNIIYLLI